MSEHRVVDVTEESQTDEAGRWWEELTDASGEGIVVKPISFLARAEPGLVHSGVKCRGRECAVHVTSVTLSG